LCSRQNRDLRSPTEGDMTEQWGGVVGKVSQATMRQKDYADE